MGPHTSMCINSSGLFAFQLTFLAKLALWCLLKTPLSHTLSGWSMWGIPLIIFLLVSIFKLVKFRCPSFMCQIHSSLLVITLKHFIASYYMFRENIIFLKQLISHYSPWLLDDNFSWKEYNLSLEVDLHSACCALWLKYSKHIRCSYDRHSSTWLGCCIYLLLELLRYL